MLALQFFVNAVQALDPAFDGRRDTGLFQLVSKYRLDPSQKSFARLAPCFDRIVNLVISDGIDITEAQVFQLASDFPHPEPVRDGGVDFKSLARNFLLPVRCKVL